MMQRLKNQPQKGAALCSA